MRSARSATTHSHGGTGRTARGEIRCPQPPLSISINQKGKRKPNFVVGFVFNILQNICTETKVQPKKGAGSGNEGGAARCPNPPRPYSTTYSHERTSSPPTPPKILLSSLYRAAPLKKKRKPTKAMKKGEMGGSPPRYGGIAGIPLRSALLPVLPVPSQGLMVGSVGGGGGRASYGEEPPRSSASAPQQGLGVVSRGAAGTAGAFHPLLRARSPLPPPLPPSQPVPTPF